MDWKLKAHPSGPGVRGPVVACVMDGVGVGAGDESDAVWLARTPHLDWLADNALATTLAAHGVAVGMPSDADMGNSEVGHNALGAGRMFDQGAKLVNRGHRGRQPVSRAKSGVSLTERVRALGPQPLHLIGLLSDGNVHSHIDHLFAMLRRAATRMRCARPVHVLLDGRDVPETSALDYVDALEELLETLREPGPRLPHRLGRWPHAGHHGPLRGRLAHRRARLEDARPGRGRGFGPAPARPSRPCAARTRASSTSTCPPS